MTVVSVCAVLFIIVLLAWLMMPDVVRGAPWCTIHYSALESGARLKYMQSCCIVQSIASGSNK